jgi:hypothetical protein
MTVHHQSTVSACRLTVVCRFRNTGSARGEQIQHGDEYSRFQWPRCFDRMDAEILGSNPAYGMARSLQGATEEQETDSAFGFCKRSIVTLFTAHVLHV